MMKQLPNLPMHPIWGGVPLKALEDDTFYAAVFQDAEAIRIDIVRKDMHDGITWDELQKIKHGCGYGEKDAVEFYPRDADIFNTGNVRHLFVFDSKLPFVRRNHA